MVMSFSQLLISTLGNCNDDENEELDNSADMFSELGNFSSHTEKVNAEKASDGVASSAAVVRVASFIESEDETTDETSFLKYLKGRAREKSRVDESSIETRTVG